MHVKKGQNPNVPGGLCISYETGMMLFQLSRQSLRAFNVFPRYLYSTTSGHKLKLEQGLSAICLFLTQGLFKSLSLDPHAPDTLLCMP